MDNSILIVEDDAVLVKMYQKKFEKDGFKVEIALDGQEALDKVAAFNPSVILLDIMLPKLDGYEVLEKIKQNPFALDIKKLEPPHKTSHRIRSGSYRIFLDIDTTTKIALIIEIERRTS